MPVSHDLCQDLDCTKDHIQQKRSEDPTLNELLKKYARINAEVVNAEKPPVTLSDPALETLKKKRLQTKDKIAELVQK